jgi:putative transposase
MARLPRLYVAGQPQHVMLRGLGGLIALADDEDYAFFVDCLRAAVRDHKLALHAYALLPSVVHLLGTPHDESSLPKTMQAVGRRYVAHFNRRYLRNGALWEGRYRATVIEAERYLLPCMRYVEAAPQHVSTLAPQDWRWSSYRHHAGLALDLLVTDHPIYWALGNTPFERQRSYRELFEQPLDTDVVRALHDATLKGWVLGGENFRFWCAQQANRRVSPLPRGRPKKIRSVEIQ